MRLLAVADEQLHYARATYSREQLDKWQADWNGYFVQYGMEVPPYAHRIAGAAKPAAKEPAAENGLLQA